MGYEKSCQDILKFDDKIRFCGIANIKGELVAGGNHNPEDKILNSDEVKMSIHYTLDRWSKTTNLSHRIGFEKAAIIEYDKVTMITVPLKGNELLLISTEPNAEYMKIVEYVSKLVKE